MKKLQKHPPKFPFAYYNEIDAQKAAWLRELIKRNVVADGIVDERSIAEIQPEDLKKDFTQCHFFAGIGVWSYALRTLAGWPDDRPVWTGSCPCPSFSAAGKGAGFDDPRHLWPHWARLIRKCKPATVFGEQADDAIGFGWLDLVQTDLERENYAVGKAVLGACSVGAPHIRQRLYFVGKLDDAARDGQSLGHGESSGEFQRETLPAELRPSDAGRMEHADSERCGETRIRSRESRLVGNGTDNGMDNPIGAGLERHDGNVSHGNQSRWFAEIPNGPTAAPSHVNGFWRNADWILRKRWNSSNTEWCPTEPGSFPLAHGVAFRVLRLRGYGDAICAPLAAEFIKAYVETTI